MKELIFLIFAHHIGDIALQSDWVAMNKGKYWFVLIWHCIIWAGCICIALEYFNSFSLWKPVFLVVGHYCIDLWKCRTSKKLDEWRLIVDQMLHFIQLIIVI